MSTLIIRLTGPMQAWGLYSHFSDRDTAREPTKSGVAGLLCAALGKPREERSGDGFPLLAEIAALRMGVRVDREGQPRYDFHTAQNVLIASSSASQIEKGSPKLKDTEPSTRHYLANAWFTVGLEGNRTLLETLDWALAAPRWPLALGRKAFVPGLPVRVLLENSRPALFDTALLATLATFKDHPRANAPAPPENRWRVVLDAATHTEGLHDVVRRPQPDYPVSFAPRRFAPRDVIEGTLTPTLHVSV